MSKFFKTIKKHKLLFLFLIFLIVLIVFAFKVITIFTDTDETAIYGERLKGQEKVEINTTECYEKITHTLGENAKTVSIRVQGRIVNVIISLNDNVNRTTAKELAEKIIVEIPDNQKSYYDFQIYITKDGDTEDKVQFPIMGYKHHTKDTITWTKDR